MTDDDDARDKTAIDNSLMNQADDYVKRGRRLAGLDVADLKEVWVATFREMLVNSDLNYRDYFNDADSEFRLRRLEPPCDIVQAELDAYARETNLLADKDRILRQARLDLLRDMSKRKN
jgi:hypothetical protein